MRGWSSVEISRYYGVSECSISGCRFTNLNSRTEFIPPPPLFSGKHYSELTFEQAVNELKDEQEQYRYYNRIYGSYM